jgi:hypothetical protein
VWTELNYISKIIFTGLLNYTKESKRTSIIPPLGGKPLAHWLMAGGHYSP